MANILDILLKKEKKLTITDMLNLLNWCIFPVFIPS